MPVPGIYNKPNARMTESNAPATRIYNLQALIATYSQPPSDVFWRYLESVLDHLEVTSIGSPTRMIEIRIVCTYDALKFAEALMRLLEAEQHEVQLCYGRQSLAALGEAKASQAATLLVWSVDAPSQHYMLEWAREAQPARLVEIARAPGAPRVERYAQPIDFTRWRGDRGGREWNALRDRLRTVERVLFPPKGPPKQALMAMGLASVAAVGGAFMARMHAEESIAPLADSPSLVADIGATDGVGGAIEAVEPPSAEDAALVSIRSVARQAIELGPHAELNEIALAQLPALRDPTLLERIGDLNPIRAVSERFADLGAAANAEPMQDRPTVRFVTNLE